METSENYYMVIPAKVWNTRINPQAILLYGHISVLSNKHGYCWATNKYFQKTLGISEATVTRCLTTLESIGVIKRHLVYKEGSKEIAKRLIWITDEHTPIVMDEPRPIITDDYTPIITDDQDNNTSSLNTINPNTININNKINLNSIESLDAGTPQAGAEEELNLLKFISLFEKVEQAFKSRRIEIGDRDRAFYFFKLIGDQVAEGIIYRLINDWEFKPTSLEEFLEDEALSRNR